MKARDNPFSIDRLDRLTYRFSDDSWETLLPRLQQLDFRASLVGSHGCGKTTLLGELGQRLETAGHRIKRLRLNEHRPGLTRAFTERFWRELQQTDLILFDGWERLSRFSAWNFLRRSRAGGGLIVTTHRSGPLPTLIECRTSYRLLCELLDDLLGERAVAVREEAGRLFERHGGNLRDVWRALYDQCADGILDLG